MFKFVKIIFILLITTFSFADDEYKNSMSEQEYQEYRKTLKMSALELEEYQKKKREEQEKQKYVNQIIISVNEDPHCPMICRSGNQYTGYLVDIFKRAFPGRDLVFINDSDDPRYNYSHFELLSNTKRFYDTAVTIFEPKVCEVTLTNYEDSYLSKGVRKVGSIDFIQKIDGPGKKEAIYVMESSQNHVENLFAGLYQAKYKTALLEESSARYFIKKNLLQDTFKIYKCYNRTGPKFTVRHAKTVESSDYFRALAATINSLDQNGVLDLYKLKYGLENKN